MNTIKELPDAPYCTQCGKITDDLDEGSQCSACTETSQEPKSATPMADACNVFDRQLGNKSLNVPHNTKPESQEPAHPAEQKVEAKSVHACKKEGGN